jgi:hypothetical protein
MGARGPVPKRSDQRRRQNKPETPITIGPGPAAPFLPPAADPGWHDLAQEWYQSLARSGQAVYYQPSDWATARYVAEAMSRNLGNSRFSAQLFAAVMGAMTELLTTEGARRRVRIELERAAHNADPDEEAADATVVDLQARLSGGA